MKRLASLASAAVLALCAAGAELVRTVSFADGAETLENPGCGFAGGGWSDLYPGMPTTGQNLCGNARNCTKLWSMHKFSKGYIYSDYDYYTNHIERLVGGADIPLDAAALAAVSNSFLKCRANGGTCIPRFAYTWDGWGGAEPDDFSVILVHIRQLGAIISLFRDVIPAVECGIIGAYGEMHTSRYSTEAYQNQIVGEWLAVLPADMALLVRSPPVWMRYLGTTTAAFFSGGMDALDPALRARMGFYNDGYLGTDGDYGTWGSGGTVNWVRREGRTFLKGQAVPYGGEFAGVSTNYFDANVHLLDPSRHNIVEEWYDTHLSYLRTIRSTGMTIYGKLASTALDLSRWAFDGMPDLSEYAGVDLRRFCEDHMGFRFVVRGLEFDSRPGSARIVLEVENTGFGQLLFAEEKEVVLSGETGAYVVPATGTDLCSLVGGKRAEVVVAFDYPENLPPGEYDVSLSLRAALTGEDRSLAPRRPVRFANAGAYDANLRANYLCSVRLEDYFDILPGGLWFACRATPPATWGGEWGEPLKFGDWTVSNFVLSGGIPRGKAGEVRLSFEVGALQEIPVPDVAGASFLFLAEGGECVPYGHTATGWRRLYGVSCAEGDAATLRIRLMPGRVSYVLDDVVLRDSAGRRWFPDATPIRSLSCLSFAGAETTEDFSGLFVPIPRQPAVITVQ